MPHFDKHFTLEEANALLPRIREVFAEIQSLVAQARGERSKVIPLFGRSAGTNGHSKNHLTERETIMARINELISEITDRGIVIQDVTRGLIDFPAFIDGEEVFLCYELEDGDSIQFYHHLNSGYAGRTPLEG